MLISLLILSIFSAGCVRRRMTVRTQPAGASVYVDKQYIGASPTATSVTYYGTREIEVVRDGYRTEKVLRTFQPPWYQIPPLDFVSETLWPKKIRDERIIDITLVPQQLMTSDELQARANNLRLQAAQGVATPIPPTTLSPSDAIITDGSILPNPALDPNFPISTAPVIPPAAQPAPSWQPGQWLRELILPGGQPPTRIPEAGILPGGGYRPEIGE